jgi:16S rRNA (adenine1518-N6/adenine1519-N6)-dimethyltransferase
MSSGRKPLRARKRFGQHFLEPAWADKLVEAIDPQPGDRFLEIGPGPGALTLRLAPRVAHLTAVEVDRDLAAGLGPRLPANVRLIEADILDLDLAPIVADGPLRVAGNLPYNISSPILFRLIEIARDTANFPTRDPADPRTREPADRRTREPANPRTREPANPRTREPANVTDATLMVQHEVAERIAATPGTGDYGVLSISVQLHADVRRLLTLPPGAFRPAPRVHSAVIRLRFRPPEVVLDDERVFEAMVRSMFTQRRKTVGNSLAVFAGSRGSNAREALAAAGIDPHRRAETLQLAELARLANVLTKA